MAVHWPNGVDVLFNPANDSLPAGQMEGAIKYACWSIRERTGIDLRYAGQTAEENLSGKIIVSIGLPEDYAEVGLLDYFWHRGFASRYLLPDGSYDSVRVVIGKHWLATEITMANKRTVIHEILHACGADHSSVDGAVMQSPASMMYPQAYAMMCSDFMPIHRGGCHTFVELTADNDLLIPCVQGKTVHLTYTGDGTTHKWKILSMRDAGPFAVESSVETVNMNKPDLVLTDIRSPVHGNLTRVELEYDLSKEEWLLKSAS